MSMLQFLSQNIWTYKKYKTHTYLFQNHEMDFHVPANQLKKCAMTSVSEASGVRTHIQTNHTHSRIFWLIILSLFFVFITYMYIPKWDGWMASLTQWTWVWASSGRLWRTVKPGMLQSMGSQRVGHDWATEQQQEKYSFENISARI